MPFQQEKLDPTDVLILEALQQDGKLSIKELADRLGMTKTPVYERIHKLERSGIIRGYVALVDKRKLPALMTAFCSVTLHSQETTEVEASTRKMLRMPEVLDCYIIGGEFDILLRVVCRDLQTYYAFVTEKIASIDNVANTKTFFVIDEAKLSTTWPVDAS